VVIHFFTNVVASNLSEGGQYQCQNSTTNPFKINYGSGCTGWDDVHGCPPPPPMYCNLNNRPDCGYNGIPESECEGKGCCWDPIDPNPGNVPWCFYKTPNQTSIHPTHHTFP